MRQAIAITTRWLWSLSLLLAWAAGPARAQSCDWASGFQMNHAVRALTVFDDGTGPALYAGGLFNRAGSVAANAIAKWNGTQWSALGGGMDGEVWALTVFDDGGGPALYAGGVFTRAGGVAANSIAKWNGTQWSPLGSGINDLVQALTVFNDGTGPALYAGGSFTRAGGEAVNHIARWTGTQWFALGNPGVVSALAVFDNGSGPALYAGVRSQVARWNVAGGDWSVVGGMSGGFPSVEALTVYDDGTGPALYAGGVFTTAGGVAAKNIAKWNGRQWSALGSGMEGMYGGAVSALTVYDDGTAALYAGGVFTTAGGVAANHIAKWNGTRWSPLSSGIGGPNPVVLALTAFDDGTGPALYAGGTFTTAGGRPSSSLAAWRCTPSGTWRRAKRPMTVGREALAATTGRDGRIYVLGGLRDGRAQSVVEVFDPSSRDWSPIAPMPTARWGLAAATGLNGKIYAIGGFSSGGYLFSVGLELQLFSLGLEYVDELDRREVSEALGEEFRRHGRALGQVFGVEVELTGSRWTIYDVDADTYFHIRNEGRTLIVYLDFVAELDEIRASPDLREQFRMHGWPLSPNYDVEVELTGSRWRIHDRDADTYFHIRNEGGTLNVSGEDRILNTVEVYDPSTRRWSSVAPMRSRAGFLAAATGLDGRIYAFGGCERSDNCEHASTDMFAYNPVNNSWTRLAPMQEERAFLAGAAGSDGLIYAIGGIGRDPDLSIVIRDSVEAYNPMSDSWSAVARMRTPRMGLAAAVSRDGTIYAIGGNNRTSTFLDTVAAYDPFTDTWITVAPMPTARRDLAAAASVLLGIDYIFAIGGHGVEFPLNTVEVLEP